MPLHNRLMLGVLRQHLGVEVPALVSETSPVPDLERYAGTFRSNQLRIDVSVVDGGLEERTSYEPEDASQERIFSGFVGGTTSAPPRRLVPVREDLFAPAGMPLQAFDGYSRQMLVSYHGASAGSERPGYRCAAAA